MLMAILVSVPASAIESISVYALFNGQAILVIDGKKQMLRAGESSPEGLKLISSSTELAVVEIGGRREELGLHINPAKGPMTAGVADININPSVTLVSDDRGFFHAEGEINNRPVTFLIDTGANTVAMSQSMANSLDLDYQSGSRELVSTANGIAPMYAITLEKVTLGPIEVENVDCAVISDPGPAGILLGMSFLQAVDMVRQGNTMELTQR
jgi:aspartyl protease family protein